MEKTSIAGQTITIHRYGTVIVGAGAAGMNCAKKLYEYMDQKGIDSAHKKIALVTAGLALGTSRMSGSDKQTYYKMGTSPDVADTAESFAESITAAGCCHHDLAMAEATGSLRAFYNLVEAGVPFPHDSTGVYPGYKTDHDPYERATSAGPKTSKFMSECLEKIVRRYGISIFDCCEVVELPAVGKGEHKRIAGVVTIDAKKLSKKNFALNVFYCDNLVLAAGGPGALYETSVYPAGQTGIHGLALEAGLAAENLTESQFGLASTKFRWNVSGSYMQVIPRIFSADPDGANPRELLTPFFPSMKKMASNIFLKGYQWPFDPQRIEHLQSSLIDLIVFNETQRGRKVFLDFRTNPIGNEIMSPFSLDDLEPEATAYLEKTDATQNLPIERLAHINPLAIEIYKEHGVDLYSEPLEIAVCAQHNNGGFAVNKWWESNIRHTFVIGEMAGTHGVKRPGGAALNAGQVGAQRAAEFIVNAYGAGTRQPGTTDEKVKEELRAIVAQLDFFSKADNVLTPAEVISQIQKRMTSSAAHIRKLDVAEEALGGAVELHHNIRNSGFKVKDKESLITAIQAQHLALASAAYLKAIVELLRSGGGSRGSYLVVIDDGSEIHPLIKDPSTGRPLKFKPENERRRNSILQIQYDPNAPDLFVARTIPPREAPKQRKPFEPAWQDYRTGAIYNE